VAGQFYAHLEGITDGVVLCDEEGLECRHPDPEVPNVATHREVVFVAIQPAIQPDFELAVLEGSHSVLPFLRASVDHTRIPDCHNPSHVSINQFPNPQSSEYRVAFSAIMVV
jgi:hypothetical protein